MVLDLRIKTLHGHLVSLMYEYSNLRHTQVHLHMALLNRDGSKETNFYYCLVVPTQVKQQQHLLEQPRQESLQCHLDLIPLKRLKMQLRPSTQRVLYSHQINWLVMLSSLKF
jgi:hypothetical protein